MWLRGWGAAIHAVVTASRPDKAFWADVAGHSGDWGRTPASTWEAIAPGVPLPADDLAHPGRTWTLNAAGDLTETQGIWMTGTEVRELATSHRSL